MITEQINKASPISRDGVLLWVLLAAASLAYVKMNGNPMEWGFDQWIDAGIAATTWLIGKLQSSPFPSMRTMASRRKR